MELSPSGILISVLIIAFFAEYVDSSLGMGYGTTLTPILLLLGYQPMQIVPAVLLSELVTGLLAGIIHHNLGNAELIPRKLTLKNFAGSVKKYGFKESFSKNCPLHLKIVLVISSCSILGTLVAVILAVNIPALLLKLYIGSMVLLIGMVILFSGHRNQKFSWRRITALGLIASFNKGLSGGGYGPVVTGGQILAGVKGKSAVAITSLSEGLTCLVGVILYCLTMESIDWTLAPYLAVGAVLSVPFAAITVKHVKTAYLRWFIGGATLILGAATILQAV
jgi:uncharacterized membrane protein YfcA